MEEPLYLLCLLLQKLGLPSGEHFYVHAHPEGSLFADLFHLKLEYLVAPHMVYGYLTLAIILVLALAGARRGEFIPSGLQNFWEFVMEILYNFTRENLPDPRHLKRDVFPLVFPLIVYFALFIGISNFMGLIPGFACPTANINVTLGLTLITIVYYHILGIWFHGPGYIKHFLGPIKWLAPLMFFIEVFSHLGRVISLSVRLFANMYSKELLVGILLFLAGKYLAPLPILLLGVVVAFVQMLIFIALSLAYFAGAVEEAH
ncbi:F0F1 ATP synthase subunit A [Thermosulfurimonas marina]|uniref:ATP synthase subunit a n=1 Tax=Thermosulfurimonas marina TaxID=2047767 RepID=A0A6H1WS90_9BACT|nr:F0F1 ATP synthase subunit A [Thermosulfurimonas marina]QJA06038.1 F0F1 ATP synthase subunit A [Thermosulfurimonas marina]